VIAASSEVVPIVYRPELLSLGVSQVHVGSDNLLLQGSGYLRRILPARSEQLPDCPFINANPINNVVAITLFLIILAPVLRDEERRASVFVGCHERPEWRELRCLSRVPIRPSQIAQPQTHFWYLI